MSTEKMRTFIIRFVFYCIILALIFIVLKYVVPILLPFMVGFLIAFFLKPLINKISEKTHKKRRLVAILTLIVFYILLTTLLIVLGSRAVIFLRDAFKMLPNLYSNAIDPALTSIQNMLLDFLEGFDESTRDVIASIGESMNDGLGNLIAAISSAALTIATNAASSLPAFLVSFLITIISSFFCVVDYYKITAFIVRLIPPRGKEVLFKIKEHGIDVLLKFAKAYAILMFLTFVEVSIGLSLLGIDYAILIAAGTAIVDILPVLGTGTILIPWGVVNLLLGNFPLGIGLLVLYAIITIVRQTLEPRVVGNQIGLYPLVTLMCMFVGSYLFGIVGLFGVPIAVTIMVQLHRSGDL